MAKNKQKNKQQQKQKPAVAKPQVVTQEMYSEAQETLEQSNIVLDTIPSEEVNVAEIQAAYTTDGSITSEDVVKCVAELKRSIKVLDSTQKRYEELKTQLEDAKKTWESEKADEERQLKLDKKTADEENAKIKNEIAQKRKELNDRELKLIEDENAAQSGDYSAVIERLIKAFKNSKEQVIVTAENHLQEEEKIAKEYLDKLANVSAKETQLDIREKELSIREKKVGALEEVIEEEKASSREEILSEVEFKIGTAQEETKRYKTNLDNAKVEIDGLKGKLESIQAAFGEIDPFEMAKVCTKLSSQIDELKDELASRPHQEDLNTKQDEVEFLTNELVELRKKFNENEYLELKKMFDNNDVLQRDKQLLVDQIESAKARENNLQDTIDDLRRTISEINESHNIGNAFKASSKYDTVDYQIPLVKGTAPSSLSAFISYLQSFMATPGYIPKSKDGLRYSKDTIKKFIAGLHMSPISILQGISGTGKTSLPEAVAIAMLADDNRYNIEKGDDELQKAPYRICPIQSGWRDKMDLMGFYNSFEKSYHETEFFNALYLANQPKYEKCLFFIVLDEMNLSRPEHYFADFLSKLELSEKQRNIKIDNVPEDICPKSIVGGTLSIPHNVRFIGTANHDEKTLEFAPKTYDRSNVIEMPRNAPKDKIPPVEKLYNVTYDWLIKQFEKAENEHSEECGIFDDFTKDEKLIKLLAERGIGIGNRLERQAKRFISVFVEAGEDPIEDTAKAADHLMTTRLLRVLKDNYDLGYDTLDKFKNDYVEVFFDHFEKEPEEAIKLFKEELEKKKQ